MNEDRQSNEASESRRRSLQNLAPPWPKGVSGNPSGRPPKRSFTDGLNHYLERDSVELQRELARHGIEVPAIEGLQVVDVLALEAIRRAFEECRGRRDVPVLREVLARVDPLVSKLDVKTTAGVSTIQIFQQIVAAMSGADLSQLPSPGEMALQSEDQKPSLPQANEEASGPCS